MKIKLFDSELKVMEVLWKEGNLTAGQLALILKEETGWNRNTTYTVIKKCIDKGAIERLEPNFTCKALISREEVQEQETTEFINKMFDGSAEMFFATFINEKNLTKEQIDKLKKLVDKLK
ncbi:putative transcriptional regulator [Anaerosolibacter carboniphilus]|uniref:Putative transcriptional regulator n=1 Tax=Anaerosolibacter carboniphilus TaxID=1417629 RepID=A0A841KTN7_9FIRM|nr:BlaI/MecI/CopY family transcriptional regulator [Anaerosolibacter carboniphilus]MBB6215390.1 putative transcriptional regulator [Anaerosolibacter carboniphilus]